jgi:ABC-type lipoprotein export system ATPase subunit
MTHKPDKLSGGEKQRSAIARALINKPSLLLCDEPTGNLDKDNSEKILSLLRDVAESEKSSLILVTHDLDIAESCTRAINLNKGMVS